MQQRGPGQGMGPRFYPNPVTMPMFYDQYPGAPGLSQYGMMALPRPMNPPTSTGTLMMTGNNRENKETIISSRYPAEFTMPVNFQPLEPEQSTQLSYLHQSSVWHSTRLEHSSHWDRSSQLSSHQDRSSQRSSRQDLSPLWSSYRDRSSQRSSLQDRSPPQRSNHQDRTPLRWSFRTESRDSFSEYAKRENDVRREDNSFPVQDTYFDDNYPDNYDDEIDDPTRDTGPLPPYSENYSDNDVYPRAYNPNYNDPPEVDEVYDRFYSRQRLTYPRSDMDFDTSQNEHKIIVSLPESFPGPSEVKKREKSPTGKLKLHKCPIPECLKENISRKTLCKHVTEDHLPTPMNLTKITLHNRIRLFCLNQLGRWILGNHYKLKNLLPLVRGVIKGEHSHVTDTEKNNIKAFCKFLKWKIPTNFDITNPSCVALLLHWRLALELLLMLTENQRNAFKKLCYEDYKPLGNKPKSQPTKAVRKILDTAARLKEISKLPVETEIAHTPIVPQPCTNLKEEAIMFDSHFHFDQTASSMKLDIAKTKLSDLLKVNQDPPPVVKVKVTGGVMVFSDPANYPHLHLPRNGFKTAFGIHPHNIDKFTKEKEDQMWELINQSPDGPVGAIGLDWMEPKETWPAQEQALCRVLKRCCVARPIILHIRGPDHDMSVYDKVLDIMKLHCGTQQPIHIHRFRGTVSVLAAWFAYFPFVYFGFAASVAIFSPTQCEGLRHVPLNRIMVESDSPFLCPHPAIEVNTPAYLGDVASIVAQARGVDLEELIRASNRNTKLFYNL